MEKKTSGSRFDYIRYDERAAKDQAHLKEMFSHVEKAVENTLAGGRAKSLVLTKLEEAYMWCGKGIRDDQMTRTFPAELQEGRKDG